MTKINHFLAPAGWVLASNDLPDADNAKLLPKEGGVLLIGWPAASQTCTVAWFDAAGKLRVVERFASKGSYWEGTFREGTRSYVFTAWKAKSKNGKPRIAGYIEAGARNKAVAAAAAKLEPGTEFDMEGTWGAEANNPGGGRGGG